MIVCGYTFTRTKDNYIRVLKINGNDENVGKIWQIEVLFVFCNQYHKKV